MSGKNPEACTFKEPPRQGTRGRPYRGYRGSVTGSGQVDTLNSRVRLPPGQFPEPRNRAPQNVRVRRGGTGKGVSAPLFGLLPSPRPRACVTHHDLQGLCRASSWPSPTAPLAKPKVGQRGDGPASLQDPEAGSQKVGGLNAGTQTSAARLVCLCSASVSPEARRDRGG